MKNFIANVEVPTLLAVLSHTVIGEGEIVAGVMLLAVAFFRLWVNVTVND
jgi:hypothetical protein